MADYIEALTAKAKKDREKAQELVQLANERSRLKHAFMYLLSSMDVGKQDQEILMKLVLDGNKMGDFERLIDENWASRNL